MSEEDIPTVIEAEGSGPHAVDVAEPLVAEPLEAETETVLGAEPAPAPEPDADAALSDTDLDDLLEALIFAAPSPLPLSRLRQLTGIRDNSALEDSLARLAARHEGRGIVLSVVSGGYQLRTAPRFAPYVAELVAGRPVRLSRAQLETLAIIAYRQPITRPEIDDIRGVDSSGTLRVLLERDLVRVLGKREEVGRPILYGTTKEFLDFFSLADLRELPTLREYAELTQESQSRLAAIEAEAEEPETPAE